MERIDIDITNEVIQDVERRKEQFREQCLNVPSIERYFEIEIERHNNRRHGEPDYMAYFDNDISLRGYYVMGWNGAESGRSNTMPTTLYWWDKEVLNKVKEKYGDRDLPKDYYPRLNIVAQEEFTEGVVDAWYYHWLKKEFVKWQENHEDERDSKSINTPLLQWNLNYNILATFFYDLLEKKVITWNGTKGNGAKREIARMLTENIADGKGKQVSEETIQQTLKPGPNKAKTRIDIERLVLLLNRKMGK